MEAPILFFDGNDARATEVRVLLLHDQLQIQAEDEYHQVKHFPFSGMSYNQVGSHAYVYLDEKGLQYLQFTQDHSVVAVLQKKVGDHNKPWGHQLFKQKTIVLFCLMLVLSAGLYIGLLHLVPFLGTRLIGVQQEIEIGTRLKELMLEEESLLGATVDTAGTRKLQAFADALNLSDQYPVQVTLVQSDRINAYALPGGQVVVYTGLLEMLPTPEALAALLAHECTHVNERHSLNGVMRNAANGILMSIVFSDASGLSGAVVSNASTLNGLRYSRSLEVEADQKGCDLLIRNGVSIKGMQELMQVLQTLGDLPPTLSFLSTHPLTGERVAATNAYMKLHPQSLQNRTDLAALFHSLKNTLH